MTAKLARRWTRQKRATRAASGRARATTKPPAGPLARPGPRIAADPGLYAILRLDPSASDAEIQTTYRRQAAKLLGNGSNDIHALKQLNVAYEVLGNPVRRAEYDRLRLTPELDDRALGSSAVFNFTFRSTMSLQENLAVLGEFVRRHGASTDQFPVPEGRYGADTRRE